MIWILLVVTISASGYLRHRDCETPRNQLVDVTLHTDAVVDFSFQFLPIFAVGCHQEGDRQREGCWRPWSQSHFWRSRSWKTLRYHRSQMLSFMNGLLLFTFMYVCYWLVCNCYLIGWTVSGGVTSHPVIRQDRLYPEPVTLINATDITDTNLKLFWKAPQGDWSSFEVKSARFKAKFLERSICWKLYLDSWWQ